MRRVLLVLAVIATMVGAAVGAGAVAGPGDPTAATHPTPPPSTPTPTVDGRTPTEGDMGMRMETAPSGVVVNGDPPELPPGCDALAGTKRVVVRAGAAHAAPGEAFGYDTERIRAPPCTRLAVTFVNEDDVRHQFMVHGLPESVYPMGMFTVEVDGPGRLTGSFVTPATNDTLHTHCSLPQHTEKGMQMQVVVGDGSAGGVGGAGHDHADPAHTHTAGGHSPSDGVEAPGPGPLAAVVAVFAAALVARRRGR
jgi:plastocyanin